MNLKRSVYSNCLTQYFSSLKTIIDIFSVADYGAAKKHGMIRRFSLTAAGNRDVFII